MAIYEERLVKVVRPWITTHPVRWVALLMLCAAYIQGALTKLFDFGGAVAEMEHFGLSPAVAIAALVIFFELTASAMILIGFCRWLGALGLGVFTLLATYVALRFWEMPEGIGRTMATNAFFEHVGLAGAFLMVAWYDLHRWRKGADDWT